MTYLLNNLYQLSRLFSHLRRRYCLVSCGIQTTLYTCRSGYCTHPRAQAQVRQVRNLCHSARSCSRYKIASVNGIFRATPDTHANPPFIIFFRTLTIVFMLYRVLILLSDIAVHIRLSTQIPLLHRTQAHRRLDQQYIQMA